MDIKPLNILINKAGIPKITDFGASLKVNCLLVNLIGRTYPYFPPESYEPCHLAKYSYDVFSLGVVLFEVLFSRLPCFYNHSNLKLGARSKEKELKYSLNI